VKCFINSKKSHQQGYARQLSVMLSRNGAGGIPTHKFGWQGCDAICATSNYPAYLVLDF